MIVQIDSKTRIAGTERACELQRPRICNGAEVWVPYKWFVSFGSALQEAIHREIRVHPATSLSEAINAVNGLVQKYERLIPSEFDLVRAPDHEESR